MSAGEEKRLPIRLGVTKGQLRAISEQAGLGPFDGKARSEYIVGTMLGEPRDELLERVHGIRDAERARLRADIRAMREQGQAEAAKRADAADKLSAA